MGRSNQQQLLSPIGGLGGVLADPSLRLEERVSTRRRSPGFKGRSRRVKPPVATKRYEASGGDSELRTYGGGEKLLIEAQEDGFVVAWSATADASKFMRAVRSLIEVAAEAELTPPLNGRPVIPFTKADAAVTSSPGDFRFITVEAEDDSFIWSAVNPNTPFDGPDAPGQVAFAFSSLNRTWVAQLIEATATEQVQADIVGILESTERLTHAAPSSLA
jgi:hypothetical protein